MFMIITIIIIIFFLVSWVLGLSSQIAEPIVFFLLWLSGLPAALLLHLQGAAHTSTIRLG